MKSKQNTQQISLVRKHSDRYNSGVTGRSVKKSESAKSLLEKLQNRYTAFSEWISSPRSRRWREKALYSLGVSVVLVGAIAVYITSFTSFDWRQWAWGGSQFSGEQLSRASVVNPQLIAVGEPEVAELFTDLTYLYPQADILNVQDDEFGVSVVAAKAFDAELQQTLLFIRVENAPFLEGSIPKIWVKTRDGQNIEAGVGEYLLENGQVVAYFITTVEGSDDIYKSASLTLDTFLDQVQPSPAFFVANFADEDTEVSL